MIKRILTRTVEDLGVFIIKLCIVTVLVVVGGSYVLHDIEQKVGIAPTAAQNHAEQKQKQLGSF